MENHSISNSKLLWPLAGMLVLFLSAGRIVTDLRLYASSGFNQELNGQTGPVSLLSKVFADGFHPVSRPAQFWNFTFADGEYDAELWNDLIDSNNVSKDILQTHALSRTHIRTNMTGHVERLMAIS